MKLKWQQFFKFGRKMFFTLVLFLLVVAAAGLVKVQAAEVITGWLWGGGAESDGSSPWDGTNTNVGWISMSNTNPGAGGSVSYGVRIEDNGILSGYAWSENIGWVSFNSADLAGCPSAPSCSATSDGTKLHGWARIVGIKDELAKNNSGGWQGWISLSGTNYGVEISKMDGNGNHPTYAWSDELGWIDFSRAKVLLPPGCATKTICKGSKFSSCDSSFCINDSVCTLTGDTTWECENAGGEKISCSAYEIEPEIGECGSAANMNFCGKSAPTFSDNLCASGTASAVSMGYSEYRWTCGSSVCGGTQVECSAPGNHCGWIEIAP